MDAARQELQLRRSLDALRHHLQTQAMAQGDYGAHDRAERGLLSTAAINSRSSFTRDGQLLE